MDTIIITAAAVVCLAACVAFMLYTRCFISKQGDSQAEPINKLDQSGLLGASISAAKSLFPDEKTGKAGCLGSLEEESISTTASTSEQNSESTRTY